MKNLKTGLGIWQILNSSLVTDIIAKSGFQITILDLEHGLHDPKTVQDCVFTAKSNSLYSMARLPCKNYQHIVQIIDTGVDAILFPHIEISEQIHEIIGETCLSPKGNKSFSPFVPKYNYGYAEKNIQNNPSIGILIESILGINNSEKLISEPNIDFVYFGAYDLSVEIDMPGMIFDNEIIKHLTKVIKYTKQYNKKILSIYRNKQELDLLIKLGVDFPIASVDTSHLITKLKVESEYYLKIKN